METVAEYLRRAEECLRIARSVAPEHRETLEAMAEAWISLANERKWRLGKESETKPQP